MGQPQFPIQQHRGTAKIDGFMARGSNLGDFGQHGREMMQRVCMRRGRHGGWNGYSTQPVRQVRPPEIAQRIGMPPWLVQKQLGRGDPAHLRRALRQLARVDLELKRSRPAAAVFERALFGVLPAPSGAAGSRPVS